MFLPASNVLSLLKTVTATPRGLACGTSSSSFILGLAVGGRVVFPPLQSVLSPPAGRVFGDTVDSPLQGRGQTAKAFLPASNVLSSLKTITATPRGLACGSSSSSFILGLAVGGRIVFPLLQSVLSPPAGRVCGDTVDSPLQRSDPVLATCQSSTSHSINPDKDAKGSPSWWRVPLLTIRYGYTFQFGEYPPRLDGVSTDDSKQRLQGFCSTAVAFLPPTERSDRGNTAVGHQTRVLQPKGYGGLRPILDLRRFHFFPLQREVQDADDENHHVSGPGGRLVCHHRPEGCVFSNPGRSKTQEIPSVRLWREGLPIQGPALRPGFGSEDIYQMHGCCTGPFEAPGHSCTELSGRLAHSGSLQGASESSQGYRSRPHPFSWPQDERQEECAPPISTNCVSRSSFGFRSDAGPFGSCPDTSSYSMSGPLQARPSCLCRYLPQAVGPYGSSLPCVAPRAASHEAIPLVDEGAEVTPHCTSYSPYQGVAQLLSTSVNVARPRLSPERGENGCDPPSPYDHDGRINDRLGRSLRRKAGEWRVEGRVPLLAYKLPGTQGCLPGFEVFSPRSRGASCHSQDGQYGGCVPHKPPRRFKVAHPGQACAPSSPLVPRQVPLFEGGSRSGSTEPGGQFSVETEAQTGRMDVEPSDGIPDLGSVWQSGGGPLCFSRVIPVPALVLPEFPADSRHRCARPPMAECQSVRVSANKVDSGSTMQSEGERCPSPSHSPILALPDLVLGANSPLVLASLGDSDQAGLTVPASGQDLASSAGALEVVGMAHTGPRAVIDSLPAEVQETIASTRAPATRKLYSSKWDVFESWCLTRAIDPVNCPVGPVLEFLQERLTARAAATTLRVYVAAIAARRELDEIPLGRHRMVSAFHAWSQTP